MRWSVDPQGSVLGAKLALRISDFAMYLVIVGVSLGLFTFIVIQSRLLT